MHALLCDKDPAGGEREVCCSVQLTGQQPFVRAVWLGRLNEERGSDAYDSGKSSPTQLAHAYFAGAQPTNSRHAHMLIMHWHLMHAPAHGALSAQRLYPPRSQ